MINQSITVINKSGKVVSTSKHLVAVWKEARAAYQTRKAEIRAIRETEFREKEARRALKNVSLSDEHLPPQNGERSAKTPGVSRSKTTAQRKPPPGLERGFSDTAYANDVVYAHPASPPAFENPDRPLIRRSTDPPRPTSAGSYDEHLAYGDLPPPLPPRHSDTEVELRGKMNKLNQLLDEANCLQYTATAMIEHLQKNPDALAAVALTLAEISAMVGRMAPGALMSMKTAFPAVVALLASPEFLIAGGLAVGVTVVMLGGYKIIKRIRENKAAQEEDSVMELREIEGDLSHIDTWRRGVADAIPDYATSVEGDFITPGAQKRLIAEGVLQPHQVKPLRRAKSERSHRKKDDAETVRSGATSRSKSRRHHKASGSRQGDGDSVRSGSSSKKGEKARKKSVGGIRMLFSRRKSTHA
jgi:hypothetical protein